MGVPFEQIFVNQASGVFFFNYWEINSTSKFASIIILRAVTRHLLRVKKINFSTRQHWTPTVQEESCPIK